MGAKASTVLTTAPPAVAAVDDEDFSMEEVAKHTAKGDCWIVVEGVIYNATSYIEEHPGGPQWISEVVSKSRPFCSHERTN